MSPQEEPVRVLLIVDDPALEEIYRAEVERYGAVCDSVQDVMDLTRILPSIPYDGLLLDVRTSMHASSQQMKLIYRLMEQYLTLKVLWDSVTQTSRTMLCNKPLMSGVTLESFLCDLCPEEPPRYLRIHQRDDLFCRVLLSRKPDFCADTAEKSCTLDISLGGCFAFSVDSWEMGDRCWLQFHGQKDLTLACEVRRVKGWADGVDRPPGVGLQFLDPSHDQLLALLGHLSTNSTN